MSKHEPRVTELPDSKAFPRNEEPRVKTRAGPPPQKPRPTVENVHNVDKHGTAEPWRKS